MAATRDVQALMDAAEQVAAGGDFVAAADLLRQAADLQEAELGPTHPDLANTLNNLGVVCERIGQPAEAERCYRRAHAIASTSLPPGHPFVEMSAKNLRDFCDARGIAFEQAPAAPPAAATRDIETGPVPDTAAGPTAVVPSTTPPAPAAPPTGSTRQLALVALVVLAVAAAMAVILRTRDSSPAEPTDVQATAPPATGAATTAPQVRGATPPPAAERGETPTDTAPPAPPSTPATPSKAAPPAASAPTSARASDASGIRVIEARVCTSLQTGAGWRCTPPDGPVSSGLVYFYTRLSSSSPTSVEHRWFQGSRLHQSIPLRVPAVSSYRLYSQLRVTPSRAGEWRVEVRSRDGDVLREVSFTIDR